MSCGTMNSIHFLALTAGFRGEVGKLPIQSGDQTKPDPESFPWHPWKGSMVLTAPASRALLLILEHLHLGSFPFPSVFFLKAAALIQQGLLLGRE